MERSTAVVEYDEHSCAWLVDVQTKARRCLQHGEILVLAAQPVTPPSNILKPVTTAWEHTTVPGEVPCHSRMIGGVLCRWWGETEPPGVALLGRCDDPAESPPHDNAALAPCPLSLCGGAARLEHHTSRDAEWWAIACTVCDLQVHRNLEQDVLAAWNRRVPDPATGALGEAYAALVTEARRLERVARSRDAATELLLTAIRTHMNVRGDDRCWQDDGALYAVLPEGDTRPAVDTAVTLENCARFIRCRQQGRTYISPERELERLRDIEEAYASLREAYAALTTAAERVVDTRLGPSHRAFVDTVRHLSDVLRASPPPQPGDGVGEEVR